MPQAMEWSLATPMIRPRLPAINPAMIPPSPPLLSFETLKGEAGVGATEPETVGHHAVELNVLFHRADDRHALGLGIEVLRSEEHTSELQSLMRISYADFCLKKKNKNSNKIRH